MRTLFLMGLIFGWQAKECAPNESYGDCEIVVESPDNPDTTPYPWTQEYTPAPEQQDPGSTDSGETPIDPAASICANALATMWAASANARPWGTPVTVASPDWIFTDFDSSPVRGEVRANFQMADPPAACDGVEVFITVGTYRGILTSSNPPQCRVLIGADPVQDTNGSDVWTSVRGVCH